MAALINISLIVRTAGVKPQPAGRPSTFVWLDMVLAISFLVASILLFSG